MTNYLRYVTQISHRYQPYIFKTAGQINEVLGGKTLVNLSNIRLYPSEIEALSAGLGFIPTVPPKQLEEVEAHTEAVDRLVRNINTSIHFDASTGRTSAPTLRGHLKKWIQSRWKPNCQQWQRDPIAIEALFRLRNPVPTPLLRGDRGRNAQVKRDRRTKHKNRRGRSGNTPEYTHPAILRALRTLKKDDTIHVMKADKGGAIVIQNVADYDREAMRQLSDIETYQSLTYEEYKTQLKEAHTAVLDAAIVLERYGHISKTELEAIRDTPLKGSAAYFLPKIHKPLNAISGACAGRPIIATHSCVVRLADKLLTEWTGPLLKLIDGSLTDTADLINRLPKESMPATATVTTADVDSLYPSIPHERGIRASIQFYREHLEELREHCRRKKLLPPPSPALFGRLLEVVMSNSLIHFKNRFFVRQLKGTAMGMCISVYFANCYMWDVTRQIRENPPPGTVTFLRYIDDILVIQADGNRATVEQIFESISDEHTKYTIDPPSREANFLDTTIYFGPECILETKPYSKPTSTMTFLHYSSNHVRSTVESIPYSQLIRLRRISTRLEHFKVAAEKLLEAFKHRGYPKYLLRKYYKEVAEMTQAELLGSPRERRRAYRDRELRKHESRMAEATRRKQIWKIPKRIQSLLAEAEAERAAETSERAERERVADQTNWRLITPYSAAIDSTDMQTSLSVLESAVKYTYPAGEPHHELVSGANTSVVHRKRQTTELLFTGKIKNPRIEQPEV